MADRFRYLRVLTPTLGPSVPVSLVVAELFKFLAIMFDAVSRTMHGFPGLTRHESRGVTNYGELFNFVGRFKVTGYNVWSGDDCERLLTIMCMHFRNAVETTAEKVNLYGIVSAAFMNSELSKCNHLAYLIARTIGINICNLMTMRTPVLVHCFQKCPDKSPYEVGFFRLDVAPYLEAHPSDRMPEYSGDAAFGALCMMTDYRIRGEITGLSIRSKAVAVIELVICMATKGIRKRVENLLRPLYNEKDLQWPDVYFVKKYAYNFTNVKASQIAALFRAFRNSMDINALIALFAQVEQCNKKIFDMSKCYIAILLNEYNFPDVDVFKGFGAAPSIGPLILRPEYEDYQSHEEEKYPCPFEIDERSAEALMEMLKHLNPNLAKLYEFRGEYPAKDPILDINIAYFLQLDGDDVHSATPEVQTIKVFKYPFVHTAHASRMHDPNQADSYFEFVRAKIINLFEHLEGGRLEELLPEFVRILDSRNDLLDYMFNLVIEERGRIRAAQAEQDERNLQIAAHNAELIPPSTPAGEADNDDEDDDEDGGEDGSEGGDGDDDEETRHSIAEKIEKWTEGDGIGVNTSQSKPVILACISRLDATAHEIVYSLSDFLTVNGVVGKCVSPSVVMI